MVVACKKYISWWKYLLSILDEVRLLDPLIKLLARPTRLITPDLIRLRY
jgi:hypothetical protein